MKNKKNKMLYSKQDIVVLHSLMFKELYNVHPLFDFLCLFFAFDFKPFLQMPHFSVFGDTVNIAALMESTSDPMRIQMSHMTQVI